MAGTAKAAGGVTPIAEDVAEGPGALQRVMLYPGNTILVRITGSIDMGPDVVRMTRKLSDHIRSARGSVRVFFDLEGFVRYHSDVRVRYTDALLPHGDKVERITVFADGRLVRMGAQVAGLVLSQLHIVSRNVFDRGLSESLRRR